MKAEFFFTSSILAVAFVAPLTSPAATAEHEREPGAASSGTSGVSNPDTTTPGRERVVIYHGRVVPDVHALDLFNAEERQMLSDMLKARTSNAAGDRAVMGDAHDAGEHLPQQPAHPDLPLRSTVSSHPAARRKQATYILTTVNGGAAIADHVLLTEGLAPGVRLVSASPRKVHVPINNF